MHNPYEDQTNIEQIILDDGRYCPEAFVFLHEGLEHAVKFIHGEDETSEDDADDDLDELDEHITGQELCYALCDLAKRRWGMLAKTVLKNWGITETIDFGNMVYLLIEHDLMSKTEADSIEDFVDVLDFDQELDARDRIRFSFS